MPKDCCAKTELFADVRLQAFEGEILWEAANPGDEKEITWNHVMMLMEKIVS